MTKTSRWGKRQKYKVIVGDRYLRGWHTRRFQTHKRSWLTPGANLRRPLRFTWVCCLVDFVQGWQMPDLRQMEKVTNNWRLRFKDDKDLRSWTKGAQAKGWLASEVSTTFGIARKVRDWGTRGAKVAGQAGLRAVNVTQAWRQVERPNETSNSDDIRRTMTGKGVIVLVSIGKRLEEIFDSDEVRWISMDKSVILIECRGV